MSDRHHPENEKNGAETTMESLPVSGIDRLENRPVEEQGREIGLTHSHADEESFAVGIVYGLARSGG